MRKWFRFCRNRADEVALVSVFCDKGIGTSDFKGIAAVDRKQKVIMRKTSCASSEDKTKFSLGVIFDAPQIQPLCVQATDKAAEKIEEWFAKKMG